MSNIALADADLGVEEIPLPPDDVRAEMIAEEEAEAAKGEPAKAAAQVQTVVSKPEIAELNFVGAGRSVVETLDYPFNLDGVRISAVTVRRLTGYEIAAFVREHLSDDGTFDRYALYSVMTGLPAPVLRGLDQDDGMKVTGACSTFLPRVLSA